MFLTVKYSVVQYVPNPEAREAVNVGVIAFDERETRAEFLHNWDRVKRFSGESIDFLKEFAEETHEYPEQWTESRVEEAVTSWQNSIQFLPLGVSLRDLDEVVDDVLHRYLNDPEPRQKEAFDRPSAVRHARSSISGALTQKLGAHAARIVKTRPLVTGNLEEHQVDVAVQNGRLYAAIQGMSFRGRSISERRRAEQVEATAFVLEDVKRAHEDAAVAVFAYPPTGNMPAYERAQRVFPKLGAEFLTVDEADRWAKQFVQTVQIEGQLI